MKHDTYKSDYDRIKAELSAFLDGPISVQGDNKPPITRHYGRTFNSVDRFNRILEHIYYLPRTESESLTILYSIFEMALIQTWALSQDWTCRRRYDEDYEYVCKFGRQLVKQLFQ